MGLQTLCGSVLGDAGDGDSEAAGACGVGCAVCMCTGPCVSGVNYGCDRAQAAFVACMNHGPVLEVLARASEEANAAYASKKPPKGRPWPCERYLHEIKQIRPAKIAVAGPDFVGITTCLQELSGLGYMVMHHDV